jgi:hypothetical protein
VSSFTRYRNGALRISRSGPTAPVLATSTMKKTEIGRNQRSSICRKSEAHDCTVRLPTRMPSFNRTEAALTSPWRSEGCIGLRPAHFEVDVYLDDLNPNAVKVELYADGIDGGLPIRQQMRCMRPAIPHFHGARRNLSGESLSEPDYARHARSYRLLL